MQEFRKGSWSPGDTLNQNRKKISFDKRLPPPPPPLPEKKRIFTYASLYQIMLIFILHTIFYFDVFISDLIFKYIYFYYISERLITSINIKFSILIFKTLNLVELKLYNINNIR